MLFRSGLPGDWLGKKVYVGFHETMWFTSKQLNVDQLAELVT